MDVLNYISPIPFYKSLNCIDSMNDYSFGGVYKNILYYNNGTLAIPPFILHTLFTSITSLSANIRNADSGAVISLSSLIQLNTLQDNGFVTIYHNGADVNISPLPLGKYYLEMYIFSNSQQYIFYSDYLYITDDIHNYIKLQWKNAHDLYVAGRTIPFSHAFEPYCYVDSLIGKPEYSFEEESTSRLGYQFIESIISKKQYRFAFIAPEYLCDAVRIMKICNTKLVTRYDLPNYGKTYNVMDMDFSVEWQEQENLAGITITLSVDDVVANVSGYLPLTTGDFNNDYNNDFSNT